MKMTYFRMNMDVRKVMEIESEYSRKSFQAIMMDILLDYYKDKLRIFRLCAVAANKSNIPVRELYLTAIAAQNSNELSDKLPQIDTNLPVIEALEKLIAKPLNRAWVQLDLSGNLAGIYINKPKDIKVLELPIKTESEEDAG